MARTETVEFTNMCMICKSMNRNNRQRIQSSASREKKGACVNSRHTRSQIEDNH